MSANIRGCGGIGRRARFRFWWETVGVQVPSPAPYTTDNFQQKIVGYFLYLFINYLKSFGVVVLLSQNIELKFLLCYTKCEVNHL